MLIARKYALLAAEWRVEVLAFVYSTSVSDRVWRRMFWNQVLTYFVKEAWEHLVSPKLFCLLLCFLFFFKFYFCFKKNLVFAQNIPPKKLKEKGKLSRKRGYQAQDHTL